jgi:SAM-dependent methyltransferase
MIEEFYQKNLTWNDRISSVIGKTHSDLDPYILNRNPPLTFKEDGKINIDVMYPPELELREDSTPYDEFYKCILSTFNMSEIGTFCDIGCSTGHLVYNMLNHSDCCGIEYFEYQRDNANRQIKECINIFDIRDPFNEDLKFDLVNCTEVSEHVDPKYLDIFLDNLKKMTKKYLILTWSSTYPPPEAPPQHISPLPVYDVQKIMNSWGFELDKDKTDAFLKQSYSYNKFYFWWRESLTIWRVK